ncbi:MAG: hypothetical protein AAGG44_07595 [Planctomycetota bacterium]
MQTPIATTARNRNVPAVVPNEQRAATRLAQPLLLSIVAHLALLLTLCLIVFPPPMGNSQILALQVWSEQQLVPTFELTSLAEPEPEELAEEPTEFAEETSLEFEVPIPELEPLPELSAPSEIAKTTSDSSETTSSDVINERSILTSSSNLVGAALASSRSIQQKVSNAGGMQGEVQFALAWKNINDLDIHVITPSGERISHLYKRSRFGGVLDVDMNVRGESKEPVENVRWLRDAPIGRYTVLVNLFRVHRPRPGDRVYRGANFQLLAHLGENDSLNSGVTSPRNQVEVFRFIYTGKNHSTETAEAIRKREENRQAAEETAASAQLADAKKESNNARRERQLNQLISRYPHTDAAIAAMRMLGGSITKNGL